MRRYSLFNSVGQCTGKVSVDDADYDSTVAPTMQSGCFAVEDSLCGLDCYYDFADERIVEFPPRPSPHHRFDLVAKQWIDPRSLGELKAEKWTEIKMARTEAEHGGFTWDGSTFDSDPVSQQRITGAVTLAAMSPDFLVAWGLADNTTRALSQLGMIQVGVALGQHIAAQFSKGVALRSQINAAATIEELNQITWS